MAYFPKDYFQGETRDGFYIEPMMKCAWAAMIEVLEVVAEICDKHNICYFADSGTLLGAVRHQGFIPWDDDMDICMLRDDYMHFLEVAPQELPEGWHVHSIYENHFRHQLHAEITNTDSINYSSTHLKRFHGFPYIAGLDLFPLDFLAPSQEEDQCICELLKIIVHTAQIYQDHPSEAQELLPEIEDLCNITLDPARNIKNQLMRLADRVSQSYNMVKTDEISYYAYHASIGGGWRLKASWYQERITLPFETISIMAPAEYDAILTQAYGDYMTPVQGTQAHEYPFWKKQEKILAKYLLNTQEGGLL